MADHFHDDPSWQKAYEIMAREYQAAGFSPEAQAAAMRAEAQKAEAVQADEEERRRAGRGGGGMNPADVNHSFNIRPDVVSGPAGLEVRTTMKSEDYRANPELEADLAEAERSANQPTLTLEAIENDPWNAVELPLPANADETLLKAARSAAEYCADGHHELMMDALAGRNSEHWSKELDAAGIPQPDAHEYNEARWLQADKRLGEINEALDKIAGRGVYAEGARPPDAPPLTNAEHDLYLETLKRYEPDDSVYDVLTEQLEETLAAHAYPPVVDALKALLPDTDGVPYPWPQTFGEVLQHIDDGVTAPQAFQQAVRAGFEADDAERRAAYDAVTEPARDDIADRLARSDRGPDGEALTSDQALQLANEESVKREDAERRARTPEDAPSDSPWASPPSLAEDLRAAERAAKAEREAEGQESVTQDHGESKTPGGGGGRGMF
jgi:hypothetical protein